ncbi:MAG TPA: putative PEP-binding protein [Polyangiaceae bacterium]|jgi:phosphocarrier protein FPr
MPTLSRRAQPETGSPAVEGIGIGRAVVWAREPPAPRAARSIREEHNRLARSLARAARSVEDLVRLLPPTEAELFEPEVVILAELGPLLLERVDSGTSAEQAVDESTSATPSDLLVDVRARLLDGLAREERSVGSLLEGRDGDRVLVTEHLTPSVVASLPERVVGIVAASEDAARPGCGFTSHAAILARGRDCPLIFTIPAVVRAIADDDVVVVDTTARPARVHTAPDDATLADARARREAWTRLRSEEEGHVSAPLTHLGLQVHVNIGSIYEHVPASADGIGLVRTELVFSEHTRAPSEAEQFGALRVIARRAAGVPIVVRLFDAAPDKPLSWLSPSSPTSRGIGFLLEHPLILDAQLRAIGRASEHADLRILLPVATSAEEVDRIRRRSGRALAVGALIESPEAIDEIDSIAEAADFICIGTNDLCATVTGQPRADSALTVDGRILRMVERIVEGAHARKRRVSVCGELAGDPHVARILTGLGVDALSVATAHFAKVKHSLHGLSLDDCRGVAREALA